LAAEEIVPPINEKLPMEILTREEIQKRFSQYIDRLLELYSLKEIIFVDVWHVPFYTDRQSVFLYDDWGKYMKENERIRIGWEVMKTKLQGCHYIPMPEWVVGDKNHHLGKYPMHYTKDFYEYAFKCIEIISRELGEKEEEKAIGKLHKEYTDWYFGRYFALLRDSYIENDRKCRVETLARKKLGLYAEFFSNLFLTGRQPIDFFREKEIHEVIFYGWSRISEFYVKYLAKTSIHVKCIVENLKVQKVGDKIVEGGIPVCPRTLQEYPPADAVVITDFYNSDKIREKLVHITDIPVYTNADILGNR